MEDGGVARHQDRWEGWEVAFVHDVGFLASARFVGVGGLVVGEDLVDAEGDVGEEEAGFDDVAAAGAEAPNAEEEGAGDGHADQDGVLAVDSREGADAPEEVEGAGDDAAGEDEQADHPGVDAAVVAVVHEVAGYLAGCLDDE